MFGLPLRPGAVGEPVRDLQRRLAGAGFSVNGEAGHFGPATEAAVAAFQTTRGLEPDGACGRQTWAVLVEAGYRPGDRLLYLRTPMLRGDDVAALQRRLGALGFDAGRVDGIFGPATERALDEFQRNAGLTLDGIFGPATLQALGRLTGDGRSSEPVVGVWEREHLRRAPRTLAERRIGLCEPGGLGGLARQLERVLLHAGASVAVVHHPDGSAQAAAVNDEKVDVCMALALRSGAAGCRTAYYEGHGWASPGGRRLAELVQAHVAPALGVPSEGMAGMALALLRETRMPAVLCELAPANRVLAQAPLVVTALRDALAAWAADPP